MNQQIERDELGHARRTLVSLPDGVGLAPTPTIHKVAKRDRVAEKSMIQ